MTTEYVVVGPPGTGKTTWISRQVERAAERYGPDRVLVASLTRAAAKEAAGRVNLSRGSVGTLHSHCHRALGQPKVVDARMIKLWNDEHPGWKLSGGYADTDAPMDLHGGGDTSETHGDRRLQQVERARQTMTPVAEQAVKFAAAWEDFKAQVNAIDFTDMIAKAYHELPLPPGDPAFLLVDEYQDHSALELALLRRWARHVDHFALVGDPNQSLYAWRHASDESSRAAPTIVLEQSYRVPERVQGAAVAFGRQSRTYLDAVYRPRQEAGSASTLDFTYACAEKLLEAVRKMEGTVMVLTSCGYMLNNFTRLLREVGHPFHNPYRAEAKWNPLARGTTKRHTAVDRLEAWLAACSIMSADEAMPTQAQLLLLAKTLLRSGATAEAKDALAELPDEPTPSELLAAMRRSFTRQACAAMAAEDVRFFLANSRADQKRSLAYPVKVLEQYGRDGLLGKPSLITGTIHSVKGGESDHVVLAPDLSVRGYESFRRSGWEHRDGVIRTFYVGMTRARSSLSVLRPHGWAVDINTNGARA